MNSAIYMEYIEKAFQAENSTWKCLKPGKNLKESGKLQQADLVRDSRGE